MSTNPGPSISAPAQINSTTQHLRPITTGGWRRGFGPMLGKELGQWWGTRQWLVQALTWLVLINGVIGLAMIMDPSEDTLRVFLPVTALVTTVGVIVTTQGAIVGEKQRGTAAWILSKPVTRTSFLLSKLTAYAIGFGVVALTVPWAIFLAEDRFIAGNDVAILPMLGALGLLGLHLLVYLALVIALGTVFDSRGPIAAIGIGVLLTGQFLGGMLPVAAVTVLPWILPELADAVARGGELPASLPTALIANGALIVAATVTGLWRLSRQEL
jgi:ABC-2 type transport system permease protein